MWAEIYGSLLLVDQLFPISSLPRVPRMFDQRERTVSGGRGSEVHDGGDPARRPFFVDKRIHATEQPKPFESNIAPSILLCSETVA